MQADKVEIALENMNLAIQKGHSLSENDYLNLASEYIKRNDLQNLVIVYEGLVKLVSGNAHYQALLAVVYSKLGRIDEAVAAATASSMRPSFEYTTASEAWYWA